MIQKTITNKNAFSLVELSIVIVIVSTILFLVLKSSDISAEAKIKLLGKETANLQKAITGFSEQYLFFPGDFPNAVTYFSCDSGSAPSGCNGDGNGLVDAPDESYRFYEHLNSADFLTGSFSGEANGSEPYSSSANLFASEVVISGLYYPSSDSSSDEYPNTNRNKLILGRFIESYTEAQIGALSPRDAMSYDLKYDDGMPRIGKVMARTFLNTSDSRSGLSSTLCLSDIASSTIANISASTYTASSDLELCELLILFD